MKHILNLFFAGLLLSISTSDNIYANSGPVAANSGPVAPTPPVNQLTTWSGLKVGALLGYGYGRTKHNLNANGNYTEFFPDNVTFLRQFAVGLRENKSFSTKGLLGGAHIGYDFQTSNNLVFGLNSSFELSNARGSSRHNTPESIVNLTDPLFVASTVLSRTITSKSRMSSSMALVANIGLAINDNLFYGGAGLVISKWKSKTNFGSDFVNVATGGPIPFIPTPAGDVKTTKSSKFLSGLRLVLGASHKIDCYILGFEGTWDIYGKQKHSFSRSGNYTMYPPQNDPATYVISGKNTFKPQVFSLRAKVSHTF